MDLSGNWRVPGEAVEAGRKTIKVSPSRIIKVGRQAIEG
jgi:hypothetical protein